MKAYNPLIFLFLCFSSYLFTMESNQETENYFKNYFLDCSKEYLYDACRKKNFTKIKKLLKENPSLINVQFKNTNTVLHELCDLIVQTEDSYNLICYLIQKGANINAQNQHGHTPLCSACVNDNSSLIKLLIKNKANTQLTTGDKCYTYNHLIDPNYVREKLSNKPPCAKVKSAMYSALLSEKDSSITCSLVPDVVTIIKNFYRQLYIAPLLSSAQYWIWEPVCIEANALKNIIDEDPIRCCLRILICWSLEEKLKINDLYYKNSKLKKIKN